MAIIASMSKVIEIKKNITTLGWLRTALKDADYCFMSDTLEELLYKAVLEAQSFREQSEGQGAYRAAVINLHTHALIKLEFDQGLLDSDHNQRQLANLATIGAITKERAHLVLNTNSSMSTQGAKLLVSIQIKGFGCSSNLNKGAIQVCADQVDEGIEISWKKMSEEALAYQDYLLPIS